MSRTALRLLQRATDQAATNCPLTSPAIVGRGTLGALHCGRSHWWCRPLTAGYTVALWWRESNRPPVPWGLASFVWRPWGRGVEAGVLRLSTGLIRLTGTAGELVALSAGSQLGSVTVQRRFGFLRRILAVVRPGEVGLALPLRISSRWFFTGTKVFATLGDDEDGLRFTVTESEGERPLRRADSADALFIPSPHGSTELFAWDLPEGGDALFPDDRVPQWVCDKHCIFLVLIALWTRSLFAVDG
jgi:hypothetical protein